MRLKLEVLHHNFNQTHILIKSTITKSDLKKKNHTTTTNTITIPNTLYIVVDGENNHPISILNKLLPQELGLLR